MNQLAEVDLVKFVAVNVLLGCAGVGCEEKPLGSRAFSGVEDGRQDPC